MIHLLRAGLPQMPVLVSSLGFPRIGPRRELKKALEGYWAGKITQAALLEDAAALRATAWIRQKAAGIDHIPSNDFSLYDHVLDTTAMVGAIPEAYGWQGGEVPLDLYFAMARGETAVGQGHGRPVPEMAKWFDTNYHYVVPELTKGQSFALSSTKPLDEFLEARSLGVHTRPVLLGPVTYLLLGKRKDPSLEPLSLLRGLLPVYVEMLQRLQKAGADWVQIDEPALVLDLDRKGRAAMEMAYATLAGVVPRLKLMLATYFGTLGDNLDLALKLPVAGLHVDLVRAPEQLDEVLAKAPRRFVLSLGVIDGRNVWRADLPALLDRLEPAVSQRGAENIILAPSCSLLHVPVDLGLENGLDPDVASWLAFAVQKLGELTALGTALNKGRVVAKSALNASARAAATRKISLKIHNRSVARRMASVTASMSRRRSDFESRRALQREQLGLPPFPTTTIGAFPQTEPVRRARSARAMGTLSDAQYQELLRRETREAVRWQEEIGIDVLVPGEFERNETVQYFGERLAGCATTRYGWVQSYGSRCVRPPIIFGDVSRPTPMTVEWSTYAQSLTRQPMKGMLTGPATLLHWSFVRDDVPRFETCRQIALALRDEVIDLEAAGIRIIQIDEPALCEGLPLRRADWAAYLGCAVECFRLSASGVDDQTQIHTHLRYLPFNDIVEAIGAMDADVISFESARSRMELLEAFTGRSYPNEIGPGVYDIHAPGPPPVEAITELVAKARDRLSTDQIWVNPDGGLKACRWEEVKPALSNMVEAAKRLRTSA